MRAPAWSAVLVFALMLAAVLGAVVRSLHAPPRPVWPEASVEARDDGLGSLDAAPRGPSAAARADPVADSIARAGARRATLLVVDAESGRPIESARVLSGDRAIATTDGTGRAMFDVGVDETTALVVRAADHRPVSVGPPADEREVRVSLETGAAIAGSVVTEAGTPVTGVRVLAWAPGSTPPRPDALVDDAAAGVESATALTDGAGRFRLGELQSGRTYAIASARAGFVSFPATLIAACPSDGVRIELRQLYLARIHVEADDGGVIAFPSGFSPYPPPSVNLGRFAPQLARWTGPACALAAAGVADPSLRLDAGESVSPLDQTLWFTGAEDRDAIGPFHYFVRTPGFEPARAEVSAYRVGPGLRTNVVRVRRLPDRGRASLRIRLAGTLPSPTPSGGKADARRRGQLYPFLALRIRSLEPADAEHGILDGAWWDATVAAVTAEPLPSGRYRVEAKSLLPFGVRVEPEEVTIGGATVGDVSLRAGPWGSVAFRLPDAVAGSPERAMLRVWSAADTRSSVDLELGDAAIVLEGVVAGAYSAGIVRDDRLLPVADFEVVAGQRTDVDVRPR
ncbi:MAG: hypothetical protein IT379_02930 [Deltaproteobacteria bacterium]|nr:hypothetical protein [Deltaproteobacteria bacterium]